jgi:hypothetical protein
MAVIPFHRGVVCGGSRLVVTAEGEGTCLGREWENRGRVVCLEESKGSWSVQWMHDVADLYPRTPVITPGGGTVIVPCGTRELSACPWRRVPWSSRWMYPRDVLNWNLGPASMVGIYWWDVAYTASWSSHYKVRCHVSTHIAICNMFCL